VAGTKLKMRLIARVLVRWVIFWCIDVFLHSKRLEGCLYNDTTRWVFTCSLFLVLEIPSYCNYYCKNERLV